MWKPRASTLSQQIAWVAVEAPLWKQILSESVSRRTPSDEPFLTSGFLLPDVRCSFRFLSANSFVVLYSMRFCSKFGSLRYSSSEPASDTGAYMCDFGQYAYGPIFQCRARVSNWESARSADFGASAQSSSIRQPLPFENRSGGRARALWLRPRETSRNSALKGHKAVDQRRAI